MLNPFDRKKNKFLVVDSQGRGLTIALFHETNDGRTDIKPIWSLKDWKEVYLELCDPTEWEPAIYLIGDWNHWKKIADGSAVAPIIAEWRKELKIKLKSMAIKELKMQAIGPKGTAAAKWLAEHGYEGKKKKEEKEERDSYEEKLIIENAARLTEVKNG
jgi:hypothetical protein